MTGWAVFFGASLGLAVWFIRRQLKRMAFPQRLEDMPRHPERVRNYPGYEDQWRDLALQLAVETSADGA